MCCFSGIQATCAWMVSGSYREIDCYHWNPRIPVQNCSTWCQPAKLTYILYWFTYSIHIKRGISQTEGIWEGDHRLHPAWCRHKGLFVCYVLTPHTVPLNPIGHGFAQYLISGNMGDYINASFWNIQNFGHLNWVLSTLHALFEDVEILNMRIAMCSGSMWIVQRQVAELRCQELFDTCILHVLQILSHLQINLNIRLTCSFRYSTMICSSYKKYKKKWKRYTYPCSFQVMLNVTGMKGILLWSRFSPVLGLQRKKEGWHPHW